MGCWALMGGAIWVAFYLHLAIELLHFRCFRWVQRPAPYLSKRKVTIASLLSFLKAGFLTIPLTFIPGATEILEWVMVFYIGYALVTLKLFQTSD